jgi:CTP synthase
MKYVLVTGGVVSGLGKGVCASSLGLLLKKQCGLRVTAVKIDPYLNVDAGTMSPAEHGECYVLDDGGEADLDLGNYERFLDVTLTRDHNLTTGKLYQELLRRERRGDFLGRTVQVVPHLTDAVQDWVASVARRPVDGGDLEPEVCMIELGGTVGDIESMPFVEALRQFQFRVGRGNFAVVHVSLVPSLGAAGEQKTKPTQHGVQALRQAGLSCNLLACRCDRPLGDAARAKLASFCHVPPPCVLSMHDVSNTWRVPLLLADQGAHTLLLEQLGLPTTNQDPPPHQAPLQDPLQHWRVQLADRWDALLADGGCPGVRVALVGKYTGLSDAYLSVVKALQHACLESRLRLQLLWVDACGLEEARGEGEAWAALRSADGVLVPGGFGGRGVEGMVLAARHARTGRVPYLGICLGMQVAVIEFARQSLEGANSVEFQADTPHPVVVAMPDVSSAEKGGTMRLGLRRTLLRPGSVTAGLYGGAAAVQERHRHRYEVNPRHVDWLERRGLRFVGKDPLGVRMEVVELDAHPFYVACQFHPEFRTRPGRPAPLFLGFVRAAAGAP